MLKKGTESISVLPMMTETGSLLMFSIVNRALKSSRFLPGVLITASGSTVKMMLGVSSMIVIAAAGEFGPVIARLHRVIGRTRC